MKMMRTGIKLTIKRLHSGSTESKIGSVNGFIIQGLVNFLVKRQIVFFALWIIQTLSLLLNSSTVVL
jgi:hypothetical protein